MHTARQTPQAARRHHRRGLHGRCRSWKRCATRASPLGLRPTDASASPNAPTLEATRLAHQPHLPCYARGAQTGNRSAAYPAGPRLRPLPVRAGLRVQGSAHTAAITGSVQGAIAPQRGAVSQRRDRRAGLAGRPVPSLRGRFSALRWARGRDGRGARMRESGASTRRRSTARPSAQLRNSSCSMPS